MNRTHCLAALAACLLASTVQADIYKCQDDSGHTTYTNGKPETGQKNCVLMTKDQPVSTAPGTTPKKASSTPTPSSFPKVDDSTQKNRDGDRRKILETELATETKALAAAKKELAEQEAIRLGDEKNYQKYIDRIQGFKDKVTLHERNIDALNKEIAKLK